MDQLILSILTVISIINLSSNLIKAQDESLCSGEVPNADPEKCCKIPIMVDDKFRDDVLSRVEVYVQQGNANLAICKATRYVLEDLKILEDGKYDLDVAIRFFYEALPDFRSMADVWRVAATDCYEWIKDHHADQYQIEHGFPKEECDVKSEVLLFCTTTRVTAVSSL